MVVSIKNSIAKVLSDTGLVKTAQYVRDNPLDQKTFSQTIDDYNLQILGGSAKEDLLVDDTEASYLIYDQLFDGVDGNHFIFQVGLNGNDSSSSAIILSSFRKWLCNEEEIGTNTLSDFLLSTDTIDSYFVRCLESKRVHLYAFRGENLVMVYVYTASKELPKPQDVFKDADLLSSENSDQNEVNEAMKRVATYKEQYVKNKDYLDNRYKLEASRVLFDDEARYFVNYYNMLIYLIY